MLLQALPLPHNPLPHKNVCYVVKLLEKAAKNWPNVSVFYRRHGKIFQKAERRVQWVVFKSLRSVKLGSFWAILTLAKAWVQLMKALDEQNHAYLLRRKAEVCRGVDQKEPTDILALRHGNKFCLNVQSHQHLSAKCCELLLLWPLKGFI